MYTAIYRRAVMHVFNRFECWQRSQSPSCIPGQAIWFCATIINGRINCMRILVFIALLFFAGENRLPAQPFSFSLAEFTTGTQLPGVVATGDFNHDGKLDLAVGSQRPPSIKIFLGKGDGTFNPGATYSVNFGPASIAVADVNGDGNPDVIFADTESYEVMLGNGDGTFSAELSHNLGQGVYPQSIAIGDFNGDGKPDIVTANYGSNDLSVYLGNGDGSFAAETRFPIGIHPYFVVVGDFNHDGKLDLAAANFGSDTVSVLLGNGDGTFRIPSNSPVAHEPVGLAAGDFNGDGKLDLVVANIGNNPWVVSVLLGKGDGTFLPAVNYPTAQPFSVVLGDFNGDGKLDVVTCSNPSGITVLFGNGDGTFQPAADFNLPESSREGTIIAGDFNRDGRPDLATADSATNEVLVLTNTTNFGLALSPNEGSGSTQTFSFTFADFNGAADIVSAQIDINPALAFSGACYIRYIPATNGINLANDSGTWQNPIPIGNAGILQNSQCSLDAGASSASASGTVLTLKVALSFKGSFVGVRNIYAIVQNGSSDGGWRQLGTWIVTGSTHPPDFLLNIWPGYLNLRAGDRAAYYGTVVGVNGFNGTVNFSVSGLPSGAMATFNPSSLTGPGQVVLQISSTSDVALGDFFFTATGSSGSLNRNSLLGLGVTVNDGPPSPVSVVPNQGGGLAQTFAFTFSNPNGAGNIVSTQMDVSATLTTVGACYFYYLPASNAIYLANDAGGWPAPLTLGSAGTLQNSQCSVDVGASSRSLSGNTLTLNLAISFKPAFAGAKLIYMEVQNGSFDSQWSAYGGWNVSNAGPPPDFSMGVSDTVAVAPGGSAAYTVTVTGVNGFSGTVQLSASGLPVAATASFVPPTITGSGSSTLTIQTVAGTSPGTYIISVTGSSGSLQHNIDSFLTIAAPPSVVSVVPNAGSGSSQTFAFTFFDQVGSANIVSAQMDMSATLAAKGSCYLYYSRGANAIYLATDAGAWPAPLTIGVAGTAQNSQCTLDAGASSVSISGVDLILNLALSFKAGFAGAKNIYTEVQDASGDSGWSKQGSWIVTVGSGSSQDFSVSMMPSAQSVSTGGSTTYTVAVSGANGFNGLVNFGVSGLPSGVTGSFNPTSVTGAGSTTLTINTIAGAPTGGFTATVTGTSGSLNHTTSATLTITGSSGGPPAAVSVTPNSGGGSSQTFAFEFFDPNGAGHVGSAQMDISATLAATGACYLYYARSANAIYLATDAGAWPAPLTIGVPGTTQNSQCSLDAGASSVTMSGNFLTLSLALSFKAGFVGAKNIYMEVQNGTQDSGWVQRGSWTTTAGGTGTPSPPSAVSVTPSSGSGMSRAFTFAYSDLNGAADIVSAQMDVSATLAAKGACYLYYAAGSNAIYLATDAGAWPAPLTVGVAGTTQNSQCSLDAGASSVTKFGNNLTLNLALTFKAGFAGAKNVYMEARNATLDSGWVLRGTWTVP